VSENLAAFTDQFPYDRSKVKALFQPVDLIYFGEDEVVFIDVKSGASSLSTKQRRIRDNVNNGKVKFRVMRINDDGISWED
jgi:predicted Holliday junction resolvase-like endonuclease